MKLKDITNRITKGTTPKSSSFGKKEVNYIKSESLNYDGIIDESKFATIDLDTHSTVLKRSILKEDDILYSIAGMNLGKIGIVEKNMLPANTNQAVAIISVDEKLIIPKYLYYYLQQEEIIQMVNSSVAQSAQPNINLEQIGNIDINVREKSVQEKIVKILDNINNTIKTSYKMNDTLFEIGKTLYQELFENDINTNNYEQKKLNEVTTNNRNKINPNYNYKVLSAVNTGNLVLSDDYFEKQVYSKNIEKYLNVGKNDFAYNPARINIGSIGLNEYDFPCCVSPVYVTFSVDKEYINFFELYFKSKKFNSEVLTRASGSVRQSLNYKDFGLIELPYPPREVIKTFNKKYDIIKNRIKENNEKIKLLNCLKKELIPKLMNGEIDLNNVEI